MDPSAFVASQELIDALEQRSTPVSCDRDRILFRQGEDPIGIYIVKSGQVRLSMQSASGQLIFNIQSGPGSVLGLPGLIGSQPYSLTAIAQKGSEVGFVAGEEFHQLMASQPLLSIKVLEVLAAEVRTARQAILTS